MNKFNNFFSNVSHIKIGENVDEETIKAIASAAKSVESKKVYDVQHNTEWQKHYTNLE